MVDFDRSTISDISCINEHEMSYNDLKLLSSRLNNEIKKRDRLIANKPKVISNIIKWMESLIDETIRIHDRFPTKKDDGIYDISVYTYNNKEKEIVLFKSDVDDDCLIYLVQNLDILSKTLKALDEKTYGDIDQEYTSQLTYIDQLLLALSVTLSEIKYDSFKNNHKKIDEELLKKLTGINRNVRLTKESIKNNNKNNTNSLPQYDKILEDVKLTIGRLINIRASFVQDTGEIVSIINPIKSEHSYDILPKSSMDNNVLIEVIHELLEYLEIVQQIKDRYSEVSEEVDSIIQQEFDVIIAFNNEEYNKIDEERNKTWGVYDTKGNHMPLSEQLLNELMAFRDFLHMSNIGLGLVSGQETRIFDVDGRLKEMLIDEKYKIKAFKKSFKNLAKRIKRIS